MRALAARELIVATRTAAVPLAALAILAALTTFVMIWAPGVQAAGPLNLYDQSRALHWLLLAFVLPWTAIRCAPGDRNDGVGLMAALVHIGPARALTGKVTGAFLLQCAVILTGLPALVLAQQAAAVPLAGVLAGVLPLFGLALLIAAVSVAAILLAADELRAWLWSSLVVLAVLTVTVGGAANLSWAGAFCGLAGGVATASLCSWLGRRPGARGTRDGQ